ncbi:MAG TPA: FtsX-like permease family protein [Candidatus Saccharimonadia bacterium]
MGTIIRGVKNAFRNLIRTGSVIVLLGISTALALSLFLANQAMKAKVADLKASAATTLTINAAGSFGDQGGGEPLTSADVTKVAQVSGVSQVGAIMNSGGGGFRVAVSSSGGAASQVQAPTSQVNLDSSIDPGTLGARRFRQNSSSGTGSATPAALPDIKLPVMMTGLQGNLDRTGTPFNVTSGTGTFSGADVPEALVGQGLATKNNLKVGSTFTAYSTTFNVVGIFDAKNQFSNDGLYVPLATAQRLTSQPGEISQISARVDSIDHLDSAKTAIGNALGNSRVDITSAAQSTTDAITALAGIQNIAFTGLVVALGAAAVITFLVMVMIVRERRREIGVLKAIGAGNIGIVGQFVTEALVLTLCGAILGVGIAAATSNQLTGALVSANQPTSQSASQDGGSGTGRFGGGPGGGFTRRLGQTAQSAESLMSNIKTNVGAPLLAEGLAAAILIAILGSAIPAYLIAKVRPAEVMRGE